MGGLFPINNGFSLIKKPSQIHGNGIFSTQFIPKGEFFYSIPLDNLTTFPKPRVAYLGNKTFVDDSRVLNWVNHSCHPNTTLEIEDLNARLIAISNIVVGEEITVDYEMTEIGGQRIILCNCGSSICRHYFKVIA